MDIALFSRHSAERFTGDNSPKPQTGSACPCKPMLFPLINLVRVSDSIGTALPPIIIPGTVLGL